MPHFSKRIQIPQGNIKFYFNRIYTVEGVKYHVSVREKLSHYFMMHSVGEDWQFSDLLNLPQWIVELRSKLSDCIKGHLLEEPEH